jgi:hypothetical protein
MDSFDGGGLITKVNTLSENHHKLITNKLAAYNNVQMVRQSIVESQRKLSAQNEGLEKRLTLLKIG